MGCSIHPIREHFGLTAYYARYFSLYNNAPKQPYLSDPSHSISVPKSLLPRGRQHQGDVYLCHSPDTWVLSSGFFLQVLDVSKKDHGNLTANSAEVCK